MVVGGLPSPSGDGYSVSTIAVVFNFSFGILTVYTVFNDSGCGFTFAISDGYGMSAVAVVFNVSFSVLTVGTGITFGTSSASCTVFNMVVVVLPLPSLIVTVWVPSPLSLTSASAFLPSLTWYVVRVTA